MISVLEIAALALFGFLLLLLIMYAAWNAIIKERPVTRVADRDEIAVRSNKISLVTAKAVTSQYVSVMSGLTGITFAGTFVVIALVIGLEKIEELRTFQKVVLYVVLGLAGSAAVLWLLALDQLTIMAAASTNHRMFFRFYNYVVDLWFIGYVIIILALILFLLLAQPIAAMAMEVATFFILLGYWNINNEWFVPFSKRDRTSKRPDAETPASQTEIQRSSFG